VVVDVDAVSEDFDGLDVSDDDDDDVPESPFGDVVEDVDDVDVEVDLPRLSVL
jgi:hypothetical protein